MSIDRALFERAVETDDPNPVLRFYQFNAPVMTVGYGMHSTANQGQANSRWAGAVKRPTGGGAVRHDGDLVYGLIVSVEQLEMFGKVKDSYHLIHSILCDTFRRYGLAAELFLKPKYDYFNSYCFGSPVQYDVMWNGRKIAGAAQKRSRRYLLHQGSIAWPVVKDQFSMTIEQFGMHFAKALAEKFKFAIQKQTVAGMGINAAG